MGVFDGGLWNGRRMAGVRRRMYTRILRVDSVLPGGDGQEVLGWQHVLLRGASPQM